MSPTTEVLLGRRRRQVAAELATSFAAAGEPAIRQFAQTVNRYPTLVRRLLAEAGVYNEAACLGMSEAEIQERVRVRFCGGATIGMLSYATGIDRRVIQRTLVEGGVIAVVPRQPVPTRLAEDFVKAYRDGASIRTVGRQFGWTFSVVRTQLVKAGVVLRPRGRR
ncbi:MULTISPECIES: helix-turn-helix domain-containing protein [unclassified Crossiella]|uniref:helix-turn-helix domain-containing protein n=1 Tax=unclassified Crossiella TaxID=2620835 RepID=UPI001FFE5D40|nr:MULTISPECIES: helix-turn-helix domain-containing protein [unclassified Crossiella]MCK2237419.1 helix-turn-helix domain-containing protein [Crossiella sp. S99.2]MCK2251074.1 helix-turn-helix domain-containing protein [Crossiella sp. S99.1]